MKAKKKHARGVLDLPKVTEERLAEGRAERESVPLEAHDQWAAPADRPDPVGILEAQDATRVAELVPIRHGRMIVSPFTFYRGSAAIMAWDLSATPTTGLRVQCCGDAGGCGHGMVARMVVPCWVIGRGGTSGRPAPGGGRRVIR